MSENGNWLSHGFKLAPSLFETQNALGWGVVLALLILLGVIYLGPGSQRVIAGYRMQEMTRELRRLQEENTYLETQIAAKQSADHLYRRALELGFVPATPDEIEYLVVGDYPAAQSQQLPQDSSAPAGSENGVSSWWRGLWSGFSGWNRATAGGGR